MHDRPLTDVISWKYLISFSLTAITCHFYFTASEWFHCRIVAVPFLMFATRIISKWKICLHGKTLFYVNIEESSAWYTVLNLFTFSRQLRKESMNLTHNYFIVITFLNLVIYIMKLWKKTGIKFVNNTPGIWVSWRRFLIRFFVIEFPEPDAYGERWGDKYFGGNGKFSTISKMSGRIVFLLYFIFLF